MKGKPKTGRPQTEQKQVKKARHRQRTTDQSSVKPCWWCRAEPAPVPEVPYGPKCYKALLEWWLGGKYEFSRRQYDEARRECEWLARVGACECWPPCAKCTEGHR